MDEKLINIYMKDFMDGYIETMTNKEFIDWIGDDMGDLETMNALVDILIKLEYYEKINAIVEVLK